MGRDRRSNQTYEFDYKLLQSSILDLTTTVFFFFSQHSPVDRENIKDLSGECRLTKVDYHSD